MSLKILFFVGMLSYEIGCFSMTEKNHCQNSSYIDNYDNNLYNEIMTSFMDSIPKWKGLNERFNQTTDSNNWKIDSLIYFNSKYDAGIMIMMKQSIRINSKMDDIKLVYCKKIDSSWHFYFNQMPAISMWRIDKGDLNTPYTFQEISAKAKRKLLEGGYLKEDCTINDEYVNNWYTRNDLERAHIRFLNGSY